MHQVRVIELNVGECEFLCPDSNAHALHLGERVRLTFSAPVLDEPLGILARVVYRSEADEGRHYRVRFPQLGKLPSCIYTLFNRRSAYRVSPSYRGKPHIRIRSLTPDVPSREADAQVKDISVSGIGLLLALDTESKFGDFGSIALELSIPGTEQPVKLIGNIRNRRLQDDQLVYGIEFDPEKTEDFAAQQEIVRRYVQELLQAEIQNSGNANGHLGSFL